jgi:hypothetical protein
MMKLENCTQIIKTRDDTDPVILKQGNNTSSFKIREGTLCSWAKSADEITPEKLRERIEPWLTALFQSEHLSLLIGSGLTTAVHFLATEKSSNYMSKQKFDTYENEIEASIKKSAKKAERGEGNFEDQIRVVNELLAGLNILVSTKPDEKKEKELEQWKQNQGYFDKNLENLKKELENALKTFAESILKDENNLLTSGVEKQEKAFNYLVSFLMSFASRTGTRDRLNIFTTNYDRNIELGADIAGLRLIDRFVGTICPIFRASRMDIDYHYNPPGIRGEPRYVEGVAHYTKLHGSIDWAYSNSEIRRIGLPFGAKDIIPYLQSCGLEKTSAMQLMIYPNPAKDLETLFYPYSELFRDFAAAICRPNSTLVCYGYGFGDEHINRIIKDMLTIPSTHLVVISYSDPNDRIMKKYEKFGRIAQITLLLGNHLGDLKTLVDHYLPKPAIDRTTIRMANLIKARLGAQDQMEQKQTSENNEGGTLP